MSLVSFEELLRRADAGDVGAMVAVGLTYLKAGDLEHGLRHMKIAADKGNAVAQMIYGDHVFSGCGVEKNVCTGAQYLKKASDQGLVQGIFHWSLCLIDGLAVVRNVREGIEFLLN